MRLPRDRKTWVEIGAWLLLVLLAPFAIELVLLADVVGAEAALVFLFVYLKASIISVKERYSLIKYVLLNAWRSTPNQEIFSKKVYILNATCSFIALWVTGSLVISIVLWVPSIYILAQYS